MILGTSRFMVSSVGHDLEVNIQEKVGVRHGGVSGRTIPNFLKVKMNATM